MGPKNFTYQTVFFKQTAAFRATAQVSLRPGPLLLVELLVEKPLHQDPVTSVIRVAHFSALGKHPFGNRASLRPLVCDRAGACLTH